MEEHVFKQYSAEKNNWLKRGRMDLIHTLMSRLEVKNSELEILEIGPGVGQNVDTLSRYGVVDVAESNPLGIQALKKNQKVRNIYPFNVPFDSSYNYDAVFALDVLEHIENDEDIIQWTYAHLQPQGFFLIFVPAFQWIYSSHDKALGHYRRYNARGLLSKFDRNWKITQWGYFNSFLFPLAASMRLIKKITVKQETILNKDSSLVPEILDKVLGELLFFENQMIRWGFRFPWGLTLYCSVEKVASES